MTITPYFNEKAIQNLCQNINMPAEATQVILDCLRQMNPGDYEVVFPRLFCPETAPQAVEWLEGLQLDDTGMYLVTFYLVAALHTKELYEQKGISERIFYDSMGFYSRCVREGMRWDGVWSFDRQEWGWRHLNLIIFRLGTLEFERSSIAPEDAAIFNLPAGTPKLALHIPRDAVLSLEELQGSIAQADDFFAKYFGMEAPLPITTDTWLLSPRLRAILPPESGILRFQSLFTVKEDDPTSTAYRLWVYGREEDPQHYAETTSLQRKIKEQVLQGNPIGSAYGIVNRGQ